MLLLIVIKVGVKQMVLPTSIAHDANSSTVNLYLLHHHGHPLTAANTE